jgi:hypothetical protein
LFSHLRQDQVGSSFHVFRLKFCTHLWSLLCLLHAPPISSTLIWSS